MHIAEGGAVTYLVGVLGDALAQHSDELLLLSVSNRQ